MKIYKLIGARQAGYGIELPGRSRTANKGQNGAWLTLRESFGDYGLSIAIGRGVEEIGELPDDAGVEQRFDALAALEERGRTWAQQEASYAEYQRLEDDET